RSALAAAARDGRDPSGRFHALSEWLALDAAPAPSLLDLLPHGAYADWPAWESQPGTQAAGELVVVRTGPVTRLGLALAAALVGGAGGAGGRPGWARRALLAGLLVALAVAAVWLPGPVRNLARLPLVAALGVAAAVALRHRQPARRPRPSAPPV